MSTVTDIILIVATGDSDDFEAKYGLTKVDEHAGCCGDWGLETPGYPIIFVLFTKIILINLINTLDLLKLF